MEILKIKDGRFDKLTISEDDGEVVLLFVPDEADPEHFHINLSPEEACNLKNWLNDFFVRKIVKERRDKLNAKI
jgi:hypothetical protein